MKRGLILTILIVTLSAFLSACVPLTPVPGPVSEAYIQTAVAKTLIAERGLAAGAALYEDGTPGTPGVDSEGTPSPGETQEDPGNEDPQPTPENPWMLQSWCEDHPSGCVKYDVQNRTDSWLQVELKKSDTGITGFFTVRSKTMSQITLIPGQYRVKYTWWCDGKDKTLDEVKSIGAHRDIFKCPQGFYDRISK
jgi:hypothetical protein